jgi:DNA replication and repair protein RecF
LRITRLRLVSFRNFASEQLTFAPGTNLLVGPNGQGKTNLLESIYLLGYGRSFRTSSPRDCIRHGDQAAAAWGTVEHGALERDLEVAITPTEKRLLVFGKEASLEDFVGNLHVLAFTGEHLKIVRGSPSERRAFLDRAMVSIYPGHLRRLGVYNRVLKQRNELLRHARDRGTTPDPSQLETWDEKLAVDGARIVADRGSFVGAMRRELRAGLFGGETLELRYATAVARDLEEPAHIEAAFRERLLSQRAVDCRAGFTGVGPHRDDLDLRLEGRSLADFGSAGQQRSSLLSLYFAQMEVHRALRGNYPVFLMDDVEAELDPVRLEALLGHLAERTQTFLTTAKEAFLPRGSHPISRYFVHAGTARRDDAESHPDA